jgi:NAD(P)-dependent dehydrogenase (short-subunit alcohol dehydrogenase family)
LCLGLLLYWVFSGSVKEELVADGTLDRIGTLEDVSRVMEFFAGPLSGFVTGQTLIVDGGGTKL